LYYISAYITVHKLISFFAISPNEMHTAQAKFPLFYLCFNQPIFSVLFLQLI